MMSKEIYVHRDIEKVLLDMLKQFPALALTGPRQCGKSTLLRTLLGDSYQYVTFDDPLTLERALSDPKLFLEQLSRKVIIDEIQYAPKLLSYIKMEIDNTRGEKGRFVFTGSQQFSMTKNLGDSLAGRIVLLELLPFETHEKRKIPSLKKSLSSTADSFIHACLRGSYPELVTHDKISAQSWYGSYLKTYLERDIRTIYNIGNLREFQNFIQLLASRTSQLLNLTSLANDLGVAVNTIKRWISILEASRVIYLLKPYYKNIGKRITKTAKVYFLDCGLVCYLTGLENKDHLLKGPMAGALFENFCIQEIVKHFLFLGERLNLFYLRSHDGLEVDLLIEGSNMELSPLEIKLTKTPNKNMAQPIEKFKKISPKLSIANGKILSLSPDNMRLTQNVALQNFEDFLREL